MASFASLCSLTDRLRGIMHLKTHVNGRVCVSVAESSSDQLLQPLKRIELTGQSGNERGRKHAHPSPPS